MTSHEAYSITINLRTMTLAYISHEQKDKNPDSRTNRRVKKIRP